MRLIDIFDRLCETTLFEMAFRRKTLINHARGLQNQIARHLIKILMFQSSELTSHWCTEVNSWLRDIQDSELKGKNQPLDRRILFEILFTEPLGTVADVQNKMNRLAREYPSIKIQEAVADVINKKLYYILDDICADIEKSQFWDIKNYL
jgi:hypothetical protein